MKLGRFKEELEGLDDNIDITILIGGVLYDVYDVDHTNLDLTITPSKEPYIPL